MPNNFWRVEMRDGFFGRLRAVAPLKGALAEGQVVALWGGRDGHAVVRGGALVAVSEQAAEDLVDPAGAAERRYRAACLAARWPDRLTRIVAPTGHDWQPGAAYPADDAGCAHVYCERVAGRHVWVRAVTYPEALSLGIRP